MLRNKLLMKLSLKVKKVPLSLDPISRSIIVKFLIVYVFYTFRTLNDLSN